MGDLKGITPPVESTIKNMLSRALEQKIRSGGLTDAATLNAAENLALHEGREMSVEEGQQVVSNARAVNAMVHGTAAAALIGDGARAAASVGGGLDDLAAAVGTHTGGALGGGTIETHKKTTPKPPVP